jgi:hypothetical protein
VPVHPPEAVQEVAFVTDQLKIENAPGLIVAGSADKMMVGGTLATATVTLFTVVPPAPVQVSV